MQLSDKDMEALVEVQGHVRKVGQILPAETRDTSPASVVGALLTVQLQHCDSILLLLMTGQNDASAEALLRPAFESFARLMWVCEDEQRALAVTANTLRFPSLSSLLHWMSKKSPKKYSKTDIDNSMKTLHGFTHAGLEQLTQYFSARTPVPLDALGAKYVALLLFKFAFAAGASFCLFTKRKQESDELSQIFGISYLLALVRFGLDAAELAQSLVVTPKPRAALPQIV